MNINEIPTEQLEAEINRRNAAKNLNSLYPKNFKGAKALLGAIIESYEDSDPHERSIDSDLLYYAEEYVAVEM